MDFSFFVKSFSSSLHKWCSLLPQACPFRSSTGLNPLLRLAIIVSSTEKSTIFNLQRDLDQLSSWSKIWQLSFNVKKCYHLGITCKKLPVAHSYLLINEIVSRLSSVQYLGITASDNMRWNEHVNNICKKANISLGLLRRILNGCNPKVKDTAYRTLIRPKLEYACSAWNPDMQQKIHQIEVQRRAARFVFNDYSRFSHVFPMLECLARDSLKNNRFMLQTSMFYKIYAVDVAILFPPEVRSLTLT